MLAIHYEIFQFNWLTPARTKSDKIDKENIENKLNELESFDRMG